MKDESLRIIRSTFPSTLSGYDSSQSIFKGRTISLYSIGEYWTLLRLSRSHNLVDIQPALFLAAVRDFDSAAKMMQDPSSSTDNHMVVEYFRNCRDGLTGLEKIASLKRTELWPCLGQVEREHVGSVSNNTTSPFTFPNVQPTPGTSPNNIFGQSAQGNKFTSSCSGGQCFSSCLKYFKTIEGQLIGAKVLMKWTGLGSVFGLNPGPGSGICLTCQHQISIFSEKGRQKLWDQLPSFFNLPPWDQLKNPSQG